MRKTAPAAIILFLLGTACFAQSAPASLRLGPPSRSVAADIYAPVIDLFGGGGKVESVYLAGSVTDFEGVPIRGAQVSVFDVETGRMTGASTGTFGRYRIEGINKGGAYIMVVSHRRFLFVTGSIYVEVIDDPVSINFQAEEIP